MDVASLVVDVVAAVATVLAVGLAWWEVRRIARDLSRRAEFRLALALEWPDVRYEEVPEGRVAWVRLRRGSALDTQLRIGFSNEGDRRAEWPLLNVIGPRHLRDFRFCTQAGKPHPEKGNVEPHTTDGPLTDLAGHQVDGWFLAWQERVVPLRNYHIVRYVRIRVDDPAAADGFPLSVTLDSDDLDPKRQPDGVQALLYVRPEWIDEGR